MNFEENSAVVVDPEKYISYPARVETENLRHHFVMVRRKIPYVPRPDGTPLPTSSLEKEERGRIFSAYLRPWVLHADDATAHVPLLEDLDLLVSDVLEIFRNMADENSKPAVRRRLRYKQPPTCRGQSLSSLGYKDCSGCPLRRSWWDAWRDYRMHHVVSNWAVRAIRHFNASQLADSLEKAEADDELNNRRDRDRNPYDNSWMKLDVVRELLRGSDSAERRRGGKDDKKLLSSHAQQIEAAKAITEDLWNVPEKTLSSFSVANKRTSVAFDKEKKASDKKEEPHEEPRSRRSKETALSYGGLSERAARLWIMNLTDPKNKKTPSEEQMACIQKIVDRCLQESKEHGRNQEFRSEPLRMVLHGVPGAGKTQTLLWIRRFFEEVCKWTHGIEFVFCTSQNTMAALIGGFTLHSFFKIQHKQRDGTTAVTFRDNKRDMSQEYVRYQALRFLFIDEFSTAAVEILAEINDRTSKHIRKDCTWSTRKSGDGASVFIVSRGTVASNPLQKYTICDSNRTCSVIQAHVLGDLTQCLAIHFQW